MRTGVVHLVHGSNVILDEDGYAVKRPASG